MFEQIFFELNSFANLITAVATAAIALLTGVLWIENRRLRKAGSAPEIVSYLNTHPDGHGGLLFVLSNVGSGPAFNVSFELKYDEEDFKSHDALLLNDQERKPISVLPQDEKIQALLGVGFKLYGKIDGKDIGPIKPFRVLTTYYDVLGNKETRENELDIRQFAGLAGVIEKSNERKITQSLEKIEKHLASVAKESSRFTGFIDLTEISDAIRQKAKGDSTQ